MQLGRRQIGSSAIESEFKECSKQLDLGLSIPAAVRAMSKRVPLTEMKILSATLSVYRQTGGSLATTLSRLATVFRERLTYQRQLRATTAAGRFSAMVVATVGPLLLIYLMFFQADYFNNLTNHSTWPIPTGTRIRARGDWHRLGHESAAFATL